MRSQASENQMKENQAHKCFPTSNSGFLQGSDLELLFWEADTGKRIDWDDVSRYHLEILSPDWTRKVKLCVSSLTEKSL